MLYFLVGERDGRKGERKERREGEVGGGKGGEERLQFAYCRQPRQERAWKYAILFQCSINSGTHTHTHTHTGEPGG